MGFSLIYERLQRHRDDDERLVIDAHIGMPGAQDELDRQRMSTATNLGFEVG